MSHFLASFALGFVNGSAVVLNYRTQQWNAKHGK